MGFIRSLTGADVRKSKKTMRELEKAIVNHKKEVAKGLDSSNFKIKRDEKLIKDESSTLRKLKIESAKAKLAAALPTATAIHIYNNR